MSVRNSRRKIFPSFWKPDCTSCWAVTVLHMRTGEISWWIHLANMQCCVLVLVLQMINEICYNYIHSISFLIFVFADLRHSGKFTRIKHLICFQCMEWGLYLCLQLYGSCEFVPLCLKSFHHIHIKNSATHTAVHGQQMWLLNQQGEVTASLMSTLQIPTCLLT